MSGVRADWHLDLDVPETDQDPFAYRIEQVGLPIDLRQEPELNERLIELVNREGELHDLGVTCPIKDRGDTACSACPVARDDRSDPLAALCAVGKEQEQVATELAVARCGKASAGD